MKEPTSMGASKFKEQCLMLLENLAPEGLIVTKHGRPVAKVMPYPEDTTDLIGCLRDKLVIHGDIFSTGVRWDASEESGD